MSLLDSPTRAAEQLAQRAAIEAALEIADLQPSLMGVTTSTYHADRYVELRISIHGEDYQPRPGDRPMFRSGIRLIERTWTEDTAAPGWTLRVMLTWYGVTHDQVQEADRVQAEALALALAAQREVAS